MVNDNQIGVLFGVEGGADVNGASGANIQKQLNSIAKQIKINFVGSLDVSKTKEQIRKQIKEIQSSINLGESSSGSKGTKTNYKNLVNQVLNAQNKLLSLSSPQANKAISLLSKDTTKSFSDSLGNLQSEIDSFIRSHTQKTGNLVVGKDDVQNIEQYNLKLKQLVVEYNKLKNLSASKKSEGTEDLSINKIIDAATKYRQQFEKTMRANAPDEYKQFNTFIDDMISGKYGQFSKKAQNELLERKNAIRAAGGEVETLGQKITRVLGEKIGYGILAVAGLYARQALGQVYTNVVNIDTAMTELKKVTDETNTTYERFLDNAGERAKKLGATITDTVTATADFSRLGYNLQDASKLADTAIVYKNVGDGISDISTASESIISTIKAFNIQASDAMSVVDKFNETGK